MSNEMRYKPFMKKFFTVKLQVMNLLGIYGILLVVYSDVISN